MRLVKAVALVAAYWCGAAACAAEETVATVVHGIVHRDQDRSRPLLESLDLGYCAIEVDVHLVGDQLLVAHDKESLRPENTLQSLYLDPLEQRCRRNGGRVYPGGPAFLLMLDIKTEGRSTYRVLRDVLARYAGMLTVVENGQHTEKGVTAVLSGNVPQALGDLLADSPQYASIDGRLTDLKSDLPGSLLPLISDHWKVHFSWRGSGPMPEQEKAKLRDIVEQAHAKGRLVRFWATPEDPRLWKELRAAGVDLINTDKPKEVRAFLLAEPQP